MHSSLALFALISSVVALPVDTNAGVVASTNPVGAGAAAGVNKREVLLDLPDTIPVTVQTAVNAFASVVANVCTSVKANVGNVNVEKVGVANGNGVGNTVTPHPRQVGDIPDLTEILDLAGALRRRGDPDIDAVLADVSTNANVLVAAVLNACIHGNVNAANVKVDKVGAANGNGIGNSIHPRDHNEYGLAILDLPAIVETDFVGFIEAVVNACVHIAAKIANVKVANNAIANGNGVGNNVHPRDIIADTLAVVQAAAIACVKAVADLYVGNVKVVNNSIANGNGVGNSVP